MNWGKGIVIGMAAFVIFIVTLVSIIMSRKVDLETENYYQKEALLDDEIQARKNWVNANLSVFIEKSNQNWIFHFSKLETQDSAQLILKHAVDKTLDQRFSIRTDTFVKIPAAQLALGQFKYQLTVHSQAKTYFTEGTYLFQ